MEMYYTFFRTHTRIFVHTYKYILSHTCIQTHNLSLSLTLTLTHIHTYLNDCVEVVLFQQLREEDVYMLDFVVSL